MVTELFKERLIWIKKKPTSVFVDAEYDKRIAENYVFDEVQGIYVSRSEHERRLRFNSDTYKPTTDEISRFPSRPKKEHPESDHSLDLTRPIPSKKDNLLKLEPPDYRGR